MTSPLMPVGIAALSSLAVHTMRHIHPGEFLRELCGGDDSADLSKKPDHSTAEATLDLSHAVPAFTDKLRQRLYAAGVDPQQPLVLKEDGWGGVVVDGDHPDRVAIEDLLAADEKLREAFQTIAREATSERDRLSPEFGPSLGEFRLQISPGNAAIGFE